MKNLFRAVALGFCFWAALHADALAATSSPGTTGLSLSETDATTSTPITYFSIVSANLNTVDGTTSIIVCGYVSQAVAVANPRGGCITSRTLTANVIPTGDLLLAAYSKLLTLPEFSGAVQVGTP